MEPIQNDPTQVPATPQSGEVVMPEEQALAATPEVTETTETEDHGVDLEDMDVEEVEEEPAFQWQASEYVQHHKGFGWYAGLAVIVIALLAVAFFTQQWLSIAVFLVMGAAVVVYAHKPPRTLLYQLDSKGIVIENKAYEYAQFRSFAVLQDLEWHAIDLEPTQRFMPRLTVIFDTEDLEGIVEHLSLHLPRADRQPDFVERLTRYLRF